MKKATIIAAVMALIAILAFIFAPMMATAADYTRNSTTQSLQAFTPTTGQTITLNRSNDTVAAINPAADIAALTISLPSSPKDGDRVTISSTKNVTALTFTAGTVLNPISSISTGSSITLLYSAVGNNWFQVSGIGGSGGMDKISGGSGSTVGAVVRKSTGFYGLAASACDLFNGANTCAAAFGWADPRWYGPSNTCGTNFNSNNSNNDDAPYIQAALNSGYPVKIPKPGCKLASRVQFSNDRQVIYADAAGGYGSNFMGSGVYLFLPNDLHVNRASTLNCAIDTSGYDNVTVRNLAVRANYNLAGSVAFCNSTGIRSGRPAAFLVLDNVMCGNMGSCIGAAMTGYLDYRGTSTTSNTLGTGSKTFTTDTGRFWSAGKPIVATALGITPTTTMTGTVTSYNSGTGAIEINVTSTAGTAGTYESWQLDTENDCVPVSTGSQAGLHNNVFQFRAKGLDMISSCMGAMGNFTDFHATDVYGAAISHQVFSSLPNGYGLTGA